MVHADINCQQASVYFSYTQLRQQIESCRNIYGLIWLQKGIDKPKPATVLTYKFVHFFLIWQQTWMWLSSWGGSTKPFGDEALLFIFLLKSSLCTERS